MEKIKDNNLFLGIIVRPGDWKKGLDFFSSSEDYLQVGSWWYDKGKKIDAHIHLREEKKALKTQEFIYVIEGRVRVDFYKENEELLRSVELGRGDTAIFLEGGHGFEILQDSTKIIEAKNGPYFGPEKDKKKFQ